MIHLPQHRARNVFHIGIDLAWADKAKKKANESGIVMLSPSGIFRTLAPMRSRGDMRTVIEGIEAMEREETTYWLEMAMHRPNPRCIWSALRTLLTEPRATRQSGAEAEAMPGYARRRAPAAGGGEKNPVRRGIDAQ